MLIRLINCCFPDEESDVHNLYWYMIDTATTMTTTATAVEIT